MLLECAVLNIFVAYQLLEALVVLTTSLSYGSRQRSAYMRSTALISRSGNQARQSVQARQSAIIGLLLVGMTLAGVMSYANVFSFLMLVCLGTPGLVLLLDSLFSL